MQVDPFPIDNYEACLGRVPVEEITATAGNHQDLELLISDSPVETNGGEIVGENMEIGDWISFSIVDKDGVYSPAGTVLKEWVSGWNLSGEPLQVIQTPYAGEPPAGTYLRVRYHREGSGSPNPRVGVNFYLHKRLE